MQPIGVAPRSVLVGMLLAINRLNKFIPNRLLMRTNLRKLFSTDNNLFGGSQISVILCFSNDLNQS